MGALREWLFGVVIAALAVALAQSLTPNGAVKRVAGVAGGCLLLLVMLRPLTGAGWDALADVTAFYAPAAASEENQGKELMKTLIAEKTGAYIADKGAELGCECTARVTVREDENGWQIPWEVEVVGRWSRDQRNALSRLIETELDIPTERQSLREVEP